jgi:hypothetical protein
MTMMTMKRPVTLLLIVSLTISCIVLCLNPVHGFSVLGGSAGPHGRPTTRSKLSSTSSTRSEFVHGSTTTRLLSQSAVCDDGHDDGNNGNEIQDNRRRILINQIGMVVVAASLAFSPSNAIAASADDEEPLPTQQTVVDTFAPIKYELNDPQGGVAYMQERINEEDWEGLMEFTKTYDLEMRKKLMGRAKKLFQSKTVKSDATTYANGVTFDLIGINRSSRKGQENVESANKYLQELREDVTKFLSLESTIEVQ